MTYGIRIYKADGSIQYASDLGAYAAYVDTDSAMPAPYGGFTTLGDLQYKDYPAQAGFLMGHLARPGHYYSAFYWDYTNGYPRLYFNRGLVPQYSSMEGLAALGEFSPIVTVFITGKA